MKCFRVAVLAGLASFASAVLALDPTALPTGGQVAAGSAVISRPSAQSLRVDQSSQNAILNWQTFSIGAGSSVVFLQPNAGAVALNRVLGSNASEIFGSLSSNGQLFLVNPNGVLFGRTAQVDVGGIAASTLGIRDSDFMAGRYVFANGGAAGSVTNSGVITTLSGYAALIGPQVSNTGLINARMGTAALAGGDKVTLDMVGDGLISVRVDQAALNASALNKGTITADGGNVLMTARSANALLDTVLNNDGIIRANALAERSGTIYLDGGTTGVTSVNGALEASGTVAGQKGGNVTVLGDKVGLFGNATVNVSGDAGGGTVLIGGNWKGKGPEANATQTYVGRSVTIKADAITGGDGGKVVVWSDDFTTFAGTLQARGGSSSGEGGIAEISGKRSLDFSPKAIDLRSPRGSPGMLLLDPKDIVVANGGTAIYSDANAFGVQSGSTQTIDPATLDAVGATVNLQATNDITVNSDIVLRTPGAGLDMRAGNDININAVIQTNAGPITLRARDPSGTQTAGGTVRIHIPVAGYMWAKPETNQGIGGQITVSNNGGVNPIYLGGTILNDSAGVSFNDNVVLINHTYVAGADLKFLGSIDGRYILTLWPNVTGLFAGNIGSKVPPLSMNVTLAGISSFKDVTTVGPQSYGYANTLNGTYTTTTGDLNAPVFTTLAGHTSFVTQSGTIRLRAVDGPYELSVNSSAPITISGNVGSVSPLVGFYVMGNGTATFTGSLLTSGIQTVVTKDTQMYGGNLVFGTPTLLRSTRGASIYLAGSLNGAYPLTLESPDSIFVLGPVGNVTPLASLTVSAGKGMYLRGTIKTTGTQTYTSTSSDYWGGSVRIVDSTSLIATNGSIDFVSVVDGGYGLELTTAGATTFSRLVGPNSPLPYLNVISGGLITKGGEIRTTGPQAYGGEVVLGAPTTLTSTAGGGIQLGPIRGPYPLVVNTSGSMTLAGLVGDSQPLASLWMGGGGTVVMNAGSINTTGSQTYAGNVVLSAATTLFSSGGDNIALGGTVEGPSSLTVSTGGTVNFPAVIGSVVPLESLSVNVSRFALPAGVTTTGPQTYTGDVTLGGLYKTTDNRFSITGATTLGGPTSVVTGAGGALFGGLVDGSARLAIDSPGGSVVFNSSIGSAIALRSLAVKAATSIAHDVTTTGPQLWDSDVTFNGTETTNGGSLRVTGRMTLGGATTINTGAGNATFSGAIDGAQALAINSGGVIALESAAGSSTPLASLAAGPGDAWLKGVTTSGVQSYGGNVFLDGRYQTEASRFSVGGATTLAGATAISTGSGGAIFSGPVDGAVPLTIDSLGGSVVFNSNIGSTVPLASIVVKAATIFAHDTTTNGDQLWDGDVTFNSTETTNGGAFRVTGRTTLGGVTTINAGGGNVTLTGPVDGPQGLTVNSNGVTTLGSSVGASVPIDFLSLDSGGSTYVGSNVTTIGQQSFGDPVSGASGLRLASLAGGTILINQASSTFPAVLATTGSVVLSGQASLGTLANPLEFAVTPSSLLVLQPISLVITSPSPLTHFGSTSGISITNFLPQLSAPVTGAVAMTSIDSVRAVAPLYEPETSQDLIEVSGQLAVVPQSEEEAEKAEKR